MKTFRCDNCGHPIFFENVQCLKCGSALAFLPDRMALCAIEPLPGKAAEGLWRRIDPSGRKTGAARYRLCHNHTEHQACNFAVPAQDPNVLCVSCRQTRVLPDLSVPANHERWYRIEIAKRRLFYTLARLGLVNPTPAPGQQDGPVYEFLADLPGQQVMTGHCNGLITLNVVEADDPERVKRRVELHEPYRTLLGHLRHESGHYYWDVLIRNAGRVEEFREVFGDESVDYGEALQRHYASGGMPANWQAHHVSAYATSHPWEDWAETWAHYLHMVDLLETAAAFHTRVEVPGTDTEVHNPFEGGQHSFDLLVRQWVPVTLLLNSLNRSLGQDDAYPFALSRGALEKLRFVHDVIYSPPPATGAVTPQSQPSACDAVPAAHN
ncbi:MAG TPA: putative zinc-binding peptidase [Ramlibacter sp.]|nr:putative zinc-binding peptidase [Ramlibacter sp.]